MNRISDKWAILMFVVLWGIVVAVADMNWPSHMGPSNVLVNLVLPGNWGKNSLCFSCPYWCPMRCGHI